MFKKILVPIDWSVQASSSSEVAIALASEQKAHILFAHVQEPVVELGLSGYAPLSTTVVEATQREIDELLQKAVKTAEEHGATASIVREMGSIPDVILDIAKREGVDLIVMGTHGREGLARAFIGSVTEAVLRRATVPVLAVHIPDAH